jgi:hypothetical protein
MVTKWKPLPRLSFENITASVFALPDAIKTLLAKKTSQ